MPILYTRPGCHLCQRAKVLLEQAQFAFSEHSISGDQVLEAQYGEEIPLLEDESGRVLLKGVFTESRVAALIVHQRGGNDAS